MNANDVIEMYIDDTVRLLPSRQRGDVANELRSLLNEELNARARESGHSADESLALSLVREYGQPNEVAARYQAPWALVDPADSTNFLRAAILGTGSLCLLSVLNRHLPELQRTQNEGVGFYILAWLGVLVVAFGLKGWYRRRSPAKAVWKPFDRDRANRIGAAVAILAATPIVILYAAPTWVFNQISRGRFDTSWIAYTPEFQRLRLPCFITLLVGLLVMLAFAAIQGRWNRLTRRIDIGLNLMLACLVLSFAVDGNIFQSASVDQITRSILAAVAVIYIPCVAAQIYGEIGRIDRVSATKLA